MRLFVTGLLFFTTLLSAITPQELDERPKLRRKSRAEGEFTVTYAEGTIFRPNTKTVSGTLKFVDCRGKTAHIQIMSENKPITFEVTDPKTVEIKGTGSKEFEFTCGPQKARPVTIEYVENKSIKSLYSLEFKSETAKQQP